MIRRFTMALALGAALAFVSSAQNGPGATSTPCAGASSVTCHAAALLGSLVPAASAAKAQPPSRRTLRRAARGAHFRGCDPIDASNCLFPFPNNHFTRADDKTDTGLRVDFHRAAMPRNLLGKVINPREWNRNDGFSPGAMILTYVPELDLEQSGAVPITDLSQSYDAAQPVLLIDAETGERQLIWSELDVNAGLRIPARGNDKLGDPEPALIIRPAKNLQPGHRYIVALRNLRDAEGETLAAPPAFRVCRDGLDTDIDAIAQRCEQLETGVFAPLAATGVARDSLYRAWDFTVASDRNLTERLLHMRDDAFASLGESGNPGDPDYQMGDAPEFTVDEVTDNPSEEIARSVSGHITVPSYLVPADAKLLDQPLLTGTVDVVSGLLPDSLGILGDALDIATGLSLPPNRLNYSRFDGDAGARPRYGDGLPDRPYPGAAQDAEFLCNIPRSAVADFDDASTADVRPARPSLYGHGLLGSHLEVNAGNVENMANEHDMMFCAIDWFGFAQGDIANVVLSLLDLSLFQVIPDASQQGMLNQMFLARLLRHPDGFAGDPAFQVDGRPVFDNSAVYYDGNSQGGILGGPVIAMSKDIDRGVLGVPGMNYSLLLRRSADFDSYAVPLYLTYRGDLERSLILALIQMIWDRSENNGYAQHLNQNPLPGTRVNKVLLHPAFGDHQVSMWSADVLARTVGARVDRSRVSNRRHPDDKPYFDIPRLDYGRDGRDISAMVAWDNGAETPPPPITNVPPRDGEDPHSFPRSQVSARCQKSHFLRPDGRVIDVAGITDPAQCPPPSE